jgi:hypothetical protein
LAGQEESEGAAMFGAFCLDFNIMRMIDGQSQGESESASRLNGNLSALPHIGFPYLILKI